MPAEPFAGQVEAELEEHTAEDTRHSVDTDCTLAVAVEVVALQVLQDGIVVEAVEKPVVEVGVAAAAAAFASDLVAELRSRNSRIESSDHYQGEEPAAQPTGDCIEG